MSHTEEKLQQVLENWHSWDATCGGASGLKAPLTKKPVVVEELLLGKTNRSFLVETAYGQVVVRINAENSQSLGIDRQREAEILLQLQPLSCVPKTLFISEQVLVSEYISGCCWKAGDLKNTGKLKIISGLLNKIQEIGLPLKATQRNYVEYCQNYIQQLLISVQQSEGTFIKELISAAETIDQAIWKPVINHHDLVPENIIESEHGLFLLDWEYGAYGHPGIDLVRLYGKKYQSPLTKELLILQQGIDKLWGFLNS